MKAVARWVTLGALFIIPFLSLYVSNGMYFPFITGKNFAFRILVEIATAGWVVLAFADRRYRPKFSWTMLWYGLLVVWMAIADAFAVNAHKAFWSNFERMDGWVTLIHVFLFFVVAGAVLSAEGLWRRWWLTFIAVTAYLCAYGFLQLAHVLAIHQSGTRVDATLGNSEYLAGYFIFAIAVTLWQAFETRTREMRWLRYALFVLAAVQTFILFETGTRGTFIGLLGAIAVGAVLWALEAGKQGRKGAAVIFAILVIAVGGFFSIRNTQFVQGNPNLQHLASAFSLKSALGTRLTIWHMAIEGIEQRPIAGWGQEGYNYIFNKFYEPQLYGQEPWFDRAHDVFLDWTVAGGIPALLIFLALLLSSAYAIYRSPVSRAERILLLSGLAGYSIQGLVVFDNLFTYIPFAAILALAHMTRSRPIRAFEEAPEVSGATLSSLVAPASLVVGCAVIWFVNVPSVKAAGDLVGALQKTDPSAELAQFQKAVNDGSFAHQEIAEQLVQFGSTQATNQNVSEDVRGQIEKYAIDQIALEVTHAPQDARLRLQYAVLLRNVGDFKDAATQSAAAHQLSPNKQSIIVEQGAEAMQAGDYAAAAGFFTQAYQLDTDYKDPIAYIASSRIMGGDIAGGKAVLLQGYGTTTVTNQALVLAYYQVKDWNDLIAIIAAEYAQDKTANSGFQLAAAYSEAGRNDLAVQQVRAVMAAHPEAAEQGTELLSELNASK